MAYLLDTCTLSELVVKVPKPTVLAALRALPQDDQYVSAVTLGELQTGIELLPPSARRTRLANWFASQILPGYRNHTLPIDTAVALRWGSLQATLRQRGLTMQTSDSLIAATALAHNLILVTRNEGDFAHSGLRVYNPWSVS